MITQEIKNDFDAVVTGLTLAITAPTEKDSQKVLDLISQSIEKLTKKQIEKAKKLALKQVCEMN
tara:strand:+ start:2687 stop:2878 length:192 start_codon:yes stop_codon:yes gene_type:complete